jgi:uncharacterized protein YbjT (DUF2867 family)
MEAKLIVIAADELSGTGRLLEQSARRRGHEVRRLPDPAGSARLADADAIVLIPRARDSERHAHGAARLLVAAARRPSTHLLLVSSFGVGYGPRHPFNRALGLLPSMAAAEDVLRASGLPYTIVRSTWLTDDPSHAHALTLTQDPHTDGMISRADLAATLMAAIEQRAARNRTFAVFNEPGSPLRQWARSFAGLVPDPPAAVA